MKNYNKPEFDINSLNNEDVITVSGGLVLEGNKNFEKASETKKYNVIDSF